MIRRPPRSTRTDTLFPYTTLFRSPQALDPGLLAGIVAGHLAEPIELPPGALPLLVIEATELAVARNDVAAERRLGLPERARQPAGQEPPFVAVRLQQDGRAAVRGKGGQYG